MADRRRICFVTGTRAEFGLMRSTLLALRDDPRLHLQLVATGMHLSAAHGRTVDAIRADGWTLDATVPWSGDLATATGHATAGIAAALAALSSDVVLVVGDRVEAFAAATAGHLSGRVVAHVHGGDRALGQVDDALRHAITKLAHVHFPATPASAARLLRLGEDRWRIHRVGSPGLDGITTVADPTKTPGPPFALIVQHPTDADDAAEGRRADLLLAAVRAARLRPVIVYPNNDPGHGGIVRRWQALTDVQVHRDVPRPQFLALLRDAAVLVGNSSSGIIEAASFGTPVVDVGPRQAGREHGPNVAHATWFAPSLRRSVAAMAGRRFPKRNPYGGKDTGLRVAEVLATVKTDDRLRRKLITY